MPIQELPPVDARLSTLNISVLRGVLSADATTREIAARDQVCQFEVRTIGPDGKPAIVPVTCHQPAAAVTAMLEGDEVVVVGSVRRRFFRSGGATQSRTEVLAHRVVPVRHKKRAAIVLRDVIARLTSSVDASTG